MQNIHDTQSDLRRLVILLDEMSVRGTPELDPTYEELDRQFAELRMHSRNQ